jgi:hypothetical protein
MLDKSNKIMEFMQGKPIQIDIFCLTLAGLMSLSARLFVKGTSLLKAKASTASFSLMRRSTRFLPGVRLYLPFLPAVFPVFSVATPEF